jgi:3,4-dihydroxy-2-butanone 4-phosphate synthase
MTIRAIVNEDSRPQDFVQPGHLFPLVAAEGGVLSREGHTEAAIDLVTLAGLRPAAVLCEICSSNGLHMAQRDELIKLAARFRLPMISIDQLIHHRRATKGEVSELAAVAV